MVTATPARPGAPASGRGVLTGTRPLLLPERSDRPGWIRLLAGVAVIAAFATALTVTLGAGAVRDGIDSLGHHTAPGVAATEDLAAALADMDSQIANLLLAGDDSSLSGTRTSALTTYEQRRTQADNDLRQATVIAGNNTAAQHTIDTLLDQLGRYEALAATIELLDNSEHNPAGHPSAAILSQYRQGADLMAGMQRATQDLTNANSGVLETAYTATRNDVTTSNRWLTTFALILFGALLGLQVMLRRTMHRRLNPALLAATGLALALVIGGAIATAQAGYQLRTAKQDAFTSLLALEQARAIGFDANADESRYLLDPDRATQYQQAYLDKSQQLAQVNVNTLPQYYPALSTPAGGSVATIGGLFGNELANLTFAGEDTAAQAMFDAYRNYQRDDQTLRREATTDLRQAISFDTSPAVGASDGDFAAFNTALDGVIAINQHAFDKAVPAGIDALSGWTNWITYVLFALAAVAIFLGIRARLAEYR